MSENDPLLVERRNLIKVKKELNDYLLKRATDKKKPSPAEEAVKVNLQKKLLKQQLAFKEEQKKAAAVKREIQKMEMRESGQESHKNIILPKYELNE